jgi:hypothetical protein
MATCELRLTVRQRWWLKPYMAAFKMVAVTIEPFLSDRHIERIIAQQSRFLATHGMEISHEP